MTDCVSPRCTLATHDGRLIDANSARELSSDTFQCYGVENSCSRQSTPHTWIPHHRTSPGVRTILSPTLTDDQGLHTPRLNSSSAACP
jgi:hypothetical protein